MSGSEHWIYQGRQQHGWFGHGTAPDGEAGANSLFDPRNAADRVDYAAASLIGHAPHGERARWAASLSDATLDRLKTAVAAWIGASELSRETFQVRLLDPYTRDETVDRLRRAALGIVKARTHDDLAKAGDDLAAAARQIGPDRWPGFLADAQRRALAAITGGQMPGVVEVSSTGTDMAPAIVPGGLSVMLYLLTRRKTETPQTSSTPDRQTILQNAPPEADNSGEAKELAKPGDAVLPDDRRKYILDGDGKNGGGHGSGRGIPGKSEFPPDWSDEKVIEAIGDVANDPKSSRVPSYKGRTEVIGIRDGVEVKVTIGADRKTIITGHPIDTNRN